MRITIDYTPAIRQSAGIGRYTRGLISALAQIDRTNQYTLFCAGNVPTGSDWPANFTVRRTLVPQRLLTLGWHRLGLPLTAERLSGRADLFHSTDFNLPPLRRARGVVTVHDLSFLRVPECADPGLAAFLRESVPASVQRARLVLADSHSTRQDLVELLRLAPERIAVVPGGVDPVYRPIRDPDILQEVRERYSLRQAFILFVGTLEPRKNLVRLVSAFASLRRETGIDHELVIAGKKGWMYQSIFDQVKAEGLTDVVRFPGFIAEHDLPAVYSLADMFVFPSLYEGFGLPPLEAMACGTPVVTSDNSSLPEAVGSAALTVEATNTAAIAGAMARILSDANLRARLADLGRAQAARFTWTEAAAQLLAAYQIAAGQDFEG